MLIRPQFATISRSSPNVTKNNEKRDARCLSLPFELVFEDLYRQEGLARIDGIFLQELRNVAPDLESRLIAARQDHSLLTAKQSSELITALAPHLEDFIGKLFGIERELRNLQARHSELAPLYSVKRRFVQRKAITGVTPEQASQIDGFSVGVELETFMHEPLTEISFANHVDQWLQAEEDHKPHLLLAAQYAAWATLSPEGKAKHKKGVLFKAPHKLDPLHFVAVETITENGVDKVPTRPRTLASSRRISAHRFRHGSNRRARSG